SGGPNGPAGSLQWAKVTDGTNLLDVNYHRYDSSPFGIRYMLGPSGYDRALAALGSESAIDAASDTTIAQWAQYNFQYDASGRVSSEVVQGQGCGCGTSGGRGTFTFSYSGATHGAPDGPNVWSRKTIETLPDGNQNIFYTNVFGGTILEVFKDVTSGQQWMTYHQYDSQNREILLAMPSAVTSLDENPLALVTGAF